MYAAVLLDNLVNARTLATSAAPARDRQAHQTDKEAAP